MLLHKYFICRVYFLYTDTGSASRETPALGKSHMKMETFILWRAVLIFLMLPSFQVLKMDVWIDGWMEYYYWIDGFRHWIDLFTDYVNQEHLSDAQLHFYSVFQTETQ